MKAPFSQRWTDLPLRTKGFAVLILPLMLLALAVAESVDVADAQSTYQDASRAILRSSDEAGQTLASLLNAETGVRGYVATANPAFLAPWDAATATLRGQLRALDASPHLTAADRRQLQGTATAEMTDLGTLVAAERAAPLSRPRLAAALRIGKTRMDRLRAIIARIQGRVQRELTVRRAHVDQLRSDALAIAVAGLVVGLAGVVAMFLFIRRVAARVDDVRVNAYRLGLGESLTATPVAGDELGRLAAELQQASDLLSTRSVELVEAHKAALATAKDKDQYLSQLGHELRTPLTAIVGFGQLLETSDKLDMEDADSVSQIIHATNHLMALTEEVKGAGPDETPLPLAMEPIELAEIGADVCSLMGPIAAERQISLGLDVPVDTSVLANRQRLSQVLINLVSNAIKYNHPGGDVRIHCLQLATGRLRLQVTDTGAGIRAELQPRVFAPYERLEAVSSEVEGTGLGLALSRAYVEAMGGAIGVQSTEGSGSTFWVDLSAVEAVVAAA
ncbi:MAG TPA: ATP-binding protein [Solirubrobacteraceae bacterium]